MTASLREMVARFHPGAPLYGDCDVMIAVSDCESDGEIRAGLSPVNHPNFP